MSLTNDLEDFFAESGEVIISEPLKFKAKLGIGQRAFGLLRVREHLTTFTEALGVGSTAASMASSGMIATKFFANSGVMASAFSAMGVGAAAVTPIGWVIGAGVIAAGAYVGVSHLFERSKDNDLIIIPKYINTPLDVLAAALIELMLPVSLKIAKADGELAQSEITVIHNFFADEWGYSSGFVTRLIEEYREQLDGVSYARLAKTLGTYCAESKDCDKEEILAGFVEHLREIIEADGVIHEQEQAQLDYLTSLLIKEAKRAGASSIVTDALLSASKGLSDSTTFVSRIVSTASSATITGVSQGATFIANAGNSAFGKSRQIASSGLNTGKKYAVEAAGVTANSAKSLWRKLSKLGGAKSDGDAAN